MINREIVVEHLPSFRLRSVSSFILTDNCELSAINLLVCKKNCEDELAGEEVHHEHALKEAILLLFLGQLFAEQISPGGGLSNAVCSEQGVDSFFTLTEHLERSTRLIVGFSALPAASIPRAVL
jgi:hypothetical protein